VARRAGGAAHLHQYEERSVDIRQFERRGLSRACSSYLLHKMAAWTLPQPDLQRVSFVADQGDGDDGRTEVIQIALGPSDGLDARRLVEESRRIVLGSPNTFQELQRQTHWGATGLYTQEILIAYFAGVGSILTVDLIRAAMAKLIKPPTEAMPLLVRADTHEAAWHSFEQCLSGAFNCPTPTMIRGERGSEGWSFVAEANGTQFEGTVSLDGRWIHVTRMLNKGSEP